MPNGQVGVGASGAGGSKLIDSSSISAMMIRTARAKLEVRIQRL